MPKKIPEEIKHVIHRAWSDVTPVEWIGSGAYGDVFKCKKKAEGTDFETYEAIKVVKIPLDFEDDYDDESELNREEYYKYLKDKAVEEIKVMDQLQGPHIVHIKDYKVENQNDQFGFYILIRMELYTNLKDIMIEHSNDTPERAEIFAKKVCKDMCLALDFCFRKNMIHRDIKPENIMCSKSGDYYLGDFGLARELVSKSSIISSRGTEAFMAPEVYTTGCNPLTDLYSLGVVLYRIVNKNKSLFYDPSNGFEAKNIAQTKRLSGNIPIPLPENCSESFGKFVVKMCAYNPEERFQSTSEILDWLNENYSEIDNKESQKVDNSKTRGLYTEREDSIAEEENYSQDDDLNKERINRKENDSYLTPQTGNNRSQLEDINENTEVNAFVKEEAKGKTDNEDIRKKDKHQDIENTNPDLKELRAFRDIKNLDDESISRFEDQKSLLLKCREVAEQLSCSKDGATGDYIVDKKSFPINVSLTFQGEKKAAMFLGIASLNDPTCIAEKHGIIVSLINKEERNSTSLFDNDNSIYNRRDGKKSRNIPLEEGAREDIYNIEQKPHDSDIQYDTIDDTISVIFDYVSNNIEKEDYSINFNHSGIKLTKRGNSKMRKLFKESGLSEKEPKNGNGSLKYLFLLTVAVCSFPSIWRKKYQHSNSMVDTRLLRLLTSIIDEEKNLTTTANISRKEIAEQLDNHISLSIFNQFSQKQLRECEELTDISTFGIADKKVASYVDSLCNWKPVVIKSAYINATLKSTDKVKLKDSTIDVNKIVEKHTSNRVKHVKTSLFFNLIIIVLLIVIAAFSKCEIPSSPWDAIAGLLPIVAGLVYDYLGVVPEYSGAKKYNKAFYVFFYVPVLFFVCYFVLVKMNREIEYSPQMFALAYDVYCVPIFALSTISCLKYLTEKKRSDRHIPLSGKSLGVFRTLSIVLCSTLTVLVMIGVIKQVKGWNAIDIAKIYEQDGDLSNGKEISGTDQTDLLGNEQTSNATESIHYYNLDLPQQNDGKYDGSFGSNYWIEVSTKEPSDQILDISKEFFTRIDKDPVMATACLAYIDKEMGTRYTGEFYSSIEDNWINELNNIADIFINDTDSWHAEVQALMRMLNGASVSIEEIAGGDIKSILMNQGDEHPVLILGSSSWPNDSSCHYLTFTINVQGTEKRLSFLIESGFNPVIGNNE